MRKQHSFAQGLCRGALALLLLVLALVGTAPAARAIDAITPQPVSLTVRFSAKGMPFTIYRVAEMSGYGDFTPTADFADVCSAEDLTGLDSEGWSTLAGTLSGYAGRAGQWSRTASIGSDGCAVFSDLRVGLYLVIGTPHQSGEKVYMAQPALVALPSRDVSDNWMYDVTIEPKPESPTIFDEIRVKKVWIGGVGPEITVQLYVNGKRYGEPQKLNADNKWTYTWDVRGVCQPATFRVTEIPVPDGYCAPRIDYTGSYFIRKSCGRTGLGKLITIVNTKKGVTPVKPPCTTLPQTGLLWWPVPLLAAGGMALFVTGWLRRRRDEEE